MLETDAVSRRASLCALGLTLVVACVASFSATGEERPGVDVVASGKDLPLYEVVRSFFDVAYDIYADRDPDAYPGYLSHYLGIESGSEEEFIVTRAVLAARAELHRPFPGIDIREPEAYQRAQDAFNGARIKALGRVYWRMVRELEARRFDLARLSGYLEQDIRPGVRLIANEPGELSAYLQVAPLFGTKEEPPEDNR